jgi:hypothetical protein
MVEIYMDNSVFLKEGNKSNLSALVGCTCAQLQVVVIRHRFAVNHALIIIDYPYRLLITHYFYASRVTNALSFLFSVAKHD